MKLKKILSLLFVMLLGASSFVFAANNNRSVYSLYSDNFIGAHIYSDTDSIPSSDTDGVKFYPWKTEWETPSHLTMTGETVVATAENPAPEGKEYIKYMWGSKEGSTEYKYNYVGCSYTCIQGLATKTSIDMSQFVNGKIKFYARSEKGYAKKCQVGFALANGAEYWVSVLTNINENWQEFSFVIPEKINGVDVKNVRDLFMIKIEEPAGTTHPVGDEFINIDNIRWVKNSGTASLSIVRKKVSDNTPVSDQTAPISFSEDTFGQGWSVADQYLELDLDGDFSSNNWRISIYSSATEEEKAGLYNSSINERLPMAFKVSCSTLPYSYTDEEGANIDTLQIGENIDETTGDVLGLYDAGKVDLRGEGAKWWYPWLYVMKKNDASDFSLVQNNVGCHTFENNNKPAFNAFTDYIYVDTYERKSKVFLACDTKKAQAVKYDGNLIVNLGYE